MIVAPSIPHSIMFLSGILGITTTDFNTTIERNATLCSQPQYSLPKYKNVKRKNPFLEAPELVLPYAEERFKRTNTYTWTVIKPCASVFQTLLVPKQKVEETITINR
jgi:hypothetical protein